MEYELKVDQVRFGSEVLEVSCLTDFEKTIDLLFEDVQDETDVSYLEDLCPYFAHIWPASRVLSQHLSTMPKAALAGRSLLEIGCGLAIPSMVAARRGALCTASDFHPDVPFFLRENLRRNQIESLAYLAADWADQSLELPVFDLIIGSDVLYDKRHPAMLSDFLQRHLGAHSSALIADPGRPHLQEFVSLMQNLGYQLETKVMRVDEQKDEVDIFVLSIIHRST